MPEYLQIRWTAGSLDEARRVARYLVQERFVASAEIIPWMESISLLNNQIETDQETLIVFQTLGRHYEAIRKVILANCKYQVPEITWLAIGGGNEEFLKWIHDSVQPSNDAVASKF